MANTVSGPYTKGASTVTGPYAASSPYTSGNANNAETQAAVALASFNPDHVTAGVILSGMLATRHNSYKAAVLTDTPLRYYRLDETSGTTVADLGSGAQPGTTQNAPTQGVAGLLTGDADTCYTFASASSQYISLPTTGLPTGAGTWTMEAWVKIAANPAANATVVSFGTGAANQAAWLFIDTTGHATLASDGTLTLAAVAALTLNTPHHLVGTYDGANARLYVDGALVGGPTAVTMNVGTTGAAIGAWFGTPNQYMNGQIDEVALYNTTLSSTRVSAHYTAGTTATTQVDVTSGTAYLIMSDSTLARITTSAKNFTTVTPSSRYDVDLNPDGTWNFAIAHAGSQTNFQTVAWVDTDGSGNVSLVTDRRQTLVKLFTSAAAVQVPALASIGGQASVGSFGAPVIVAQSLNQNVTVSNTYVYIIHATGLPQGWYRASLNGYITNTGAITANVFYDDPNNIASGVNQYFTAAFATPIVLSGNVVGSAQSFATSPLVFYAGGSPSYAINISYKNTAATVNDYISGFLERIG